MDGKTVKARGAKDSPAFEAVDIMFSIDVFVNFWKLAEKTAGSTENAPVAIVSAARTAMTHKDDRIVWKVLGLARLISAIRKETKVPKISWFTGSDNHAEAPLQRLPGSTAPMPPKKA